MLTLCKPSGELYLGSEAEIISHNLVVDLRTVDAISLAGAHAVPV